ncbi:hypothetical protein [Pseudomonas sp. MWU12-2323]|uniref:hypothetical protein n=1 Tax=Pseudomonas sp. MWU12-2323 TaxID=2651296 RepID=UPI00128E3A48|nr:hypothetical protein [Pseudomonas sp. MWU12-2323]MPQ69307.1 hypothetical protein [Pseudomonas sp. MWU12-2323]
MRLTNKLMIDENLGLVAGLLLFASTTAGLFGHKIGASVLGTIGITFAVRLGWSKRTQSRAQAKSLYIKEKP